MILDEATSVLDGKTDEQIQVAIREAFNQSTLLLISHRFENILNLDKTLEIEDGTVSLAENAPFLFQKPLNPVWGWY